MYIKNLSSQHSKTTFKQDFTWIFQSLENFKKKLLIHRPVAKDCPCINRGVGVHMNFFDLLNLDQSILDSA